MSTTPNRLLPVKREVSLPPAVWKQAAPVVIRGVALVAVGVIAEMMLRSATKKAVSVPFGGAKKSRAIAQPAAPKTISYTETIVVQRSITQR